MILCQHYITWSWCWLLLKQQCKCYTLMKLNFGWNRLYMLVWFAKKRNSSYRHTERMIVRFYYDTFCILCKMRAVAAEAAIATNRWRQFLSIQLKPRYCLLKLFFSRISIFREKLSTHIFRYIAILTCVQHIFSVLSNFRISAESLREVRDEAKMNSMRKLLEVIIFRFLWISFRCGWWFCLVHFFFSCSIRISTMNRFIPLTSCSHD